MMNATFVSIKVDREERPDIDKVYMNVCQMLTGQGGWPLTVIMTPDKKPFFAGTYFPKTGRYGRIGMLELVPRIDEIWKTRRGELEQDALKVVEALRESSATVSSDHKLDAALLEKAYESLASRYDTTFAGFGEAPKFPTPHNLTFLLRWWKRSGSTQALAMAVRTLRAMRLGLKSDSRKVLRDFAGNCLSLGEEAFQDEVVTLFTAAHRANLAAGLDYLLGRDLRPLLAKLKAPATIIQGDQDPIVPPEQAQFLHEHLPGSSLRLLPGAGHLPFWTQGETFNRILKEMIEG